VSTSKRPASDRYHHGALRAALIAAGLAEIEAVGVEGLSLRKLAKAAGVSHNAPYMHFSDREDLIAALAVAGFEALQSALAAAYASSSWPDAFRVTFAAYLDAANARPALYGVMFQGFDREKQAVAYQASMTAFESLVEMVKEGQQAGVIAEADPAQIGLSVWTTLHGLASLLTSRRSLPDVFGDAGLDAVTERLVEQLMTGIGRRQG